jgi:catechol 2,3-dioxygenase-like lactoylglutathione lyase family enzyme
MPQHLTLITLVVRDYDEAIAFYTQKLGFTLAEDSPRENGKRWVRVTPPGSSGPSLLLARAATPEQLASVGNQTGGRVFLFLETDDFDRDHAALQARGVRFVRDPKDELYGRVGVLEDLYGNRIDLIGPARP